MTALLVTAIAAIWLACGLLHAGWWFAYFQEGWPSLADKNWRRDWWGGAITGLAGPAAFLGDLLCGAATLYDRRRMRRRGLKPYGPLDRLPWSAGWRLRYVPPVDPMGWPDDEPMPHPDRVEGR